MLDKLSARERNLLVLLLGVVFIGLMYFGLFKYLYPQYRLVKDELNMQRQYLNDVNSRVKELNALEEKNNELHQKLQRLTDSINKEVRNGVNYYYLGKHAVDNGVIIRELIPQPNEDFEQYIIMPVELKVRGKYQNTLNFIQQIEKEMPNTSEIKSLRIRPADWAGTGQSEGEAESYFSRLAEGSSGSLAKFFSEKDPDVDVFISLVTYMVKSPQAIDLLQGKPLGRLDAFSPTVDIPITEQEKEPGGEVLPGGNKSIPKETLPVTGGSAVPFPNLPERDRLDETDILPVPQVIIKEKGNYSFPEREAN